MVRHACKLQRSGPKPDEISLFACKKGILEYMNRKRKLEFVQVFKEGICFKWCLRHWFAVVGMVRNRSFLWMNGKFDEKLNQTYLRNTMDGLDLK